MMAEQERHRGTVRSAESPMPAQAEPIGTLMQAAPSKMPEPRAAMQRARQNLNHRSRQTLLSRTGRARLPRSGPDPPQLPMPRLSITPRRPSAARPRLTSPLRIAKRGGQMPSRVRRPNQQSHPGTAGLLRNHHRGIRESHPRRL